MKTPNHWASIIALLVLMAHPTTAAEPDSKYLHGMLGQLASDDIWQLSDPDTGEPLTADLDNLIYGGASVQMNFSESAWEYGYESGGLVSFQNDTNYFFASGDQGGVIGAQIDNNFFLLDLYMGGFVGLKLGHHLRLYGAAGPALLVGSLEVEDQSPSPTPQTIVISGKGRTTKATAGLYARFGIDLIFDGDLTVGASVRQVNAELDFGSIGAMNFNQPQYFINIGKAY